MRESVAALAVIRRGDGEGTRWLAQWNRRWGCYHLVGGHKRSAESFRQCLVRELEEEIQVREGADYAVAAEPPTHLEFTAWSEGAGEETRYTMELFEVRLSEPARARVEARPENRWLSAAEVRAGMAADGRPVSPTMQRLMEALTQRKLDPPGECEPQRPIV